ADVGDEKAMRKLIADIDGRLTPLRVVVHAAGIGDDALVSTLDAETLRRTMHPKIRGTLVLDRLLQHTVLDAFICFSSVAAVWGSGRQPGYAAANAFLDAWACARRSQGFPAYSVSWGPWLGGGMSTPQALDAVARRGIFGLSPELSLQA